MLIYLKKLKVTKCDLAILSGENSNYEMKGSVKQIKIHK